MCDGGERETVCVCVCASIKGRSREDVTIEFSWLVVQDKSGVKDDDVGLNVLRFVSKWKWLSVMVSKGIDMEMNEG